jgi:ribonuclease HI
MMKWSLELSEFDIHYESRKALKAQVFADFLTEMTFPPEESSEEWTVFVDGSSNSKGSGAGIIVEDNKCIIVKISLALSFPVTNNTAEYEAFLAGLRTAKDMGARRVKIFTDSQLVASQVTGEFQVKEDHLQKYVQLVLKKMKEFEAVEVTHVPREQNTRADILSKLASTEPSIQNKETRPQEVNSIIGMEDWRRPISRYIESGELPSNPQEKTRLKRRACSFTLVEGTLYKRGFITPLIKCLGPNETQEVLADIHDGICGQLLGAKALAKKVLRVGYYWPTMFKDAQDYVNLCDKCQRHGDMHLAAPAELTSLVSPWPFTWWGIDLLGPFPKATGQLKYLVVAINYSTKWIEAEPLAKITAKNILRFFKRNILARFGVPALVISDNGTQFTDQRF